MHRPPQLRLLPLAVGLIAFCTLLPIELQVPIWQPVSFNVADFVVNLLLYAPLGIALRRFPLGAVLAIAAALSTTIEALQLWSFVRYSSPYDVIANACGAAIAASGAVILEKRNFRIPGGVRLTPLGGLTAAVAAIVLLSIRALPITPSDLTSWDSSFDLVLGNEVTGDRPWRGMVESLAIVPGVLPRSLLDGIIDLDDPEIRADLLAQGAYVLPKALSLKGGPPVQAPAESASRIANRTVALGAFTIIADFVAADEEQEGPARLVSLSRDTLNRNFDLGQENRDIVFRIRTLSTGHNGNDPRTEAPEAIVAGRSTRVVASYDGAIARIHVDGRLAGRLNLAAAGCALPSLCDADAPLAQALLGAALAVLALVLFPPQRHMQVLLACTCAGLAGAIAMRTLFPQDPMQMFQPWTDAAVVLGGLWIAISVRFARSPGRPPSIPC